MKINEFTCKSFSRWLAILLEISIIPGEAFKKSKRQVFEEKLINEPTRWFKKSLIALSDLTVSWFITWKYNILINTIFHNKKYLGFICNV